MREQELIQKLTDDPEVRRRFREAPDQVVEEYGIPLNEDQRRRLREHDWSSLSDEELIRTVSAHPGLRAMF